MLKNKINIVVRNLTLNMTSFKINLDIINKFFMLILDYKNAKNIPISQFLLKILAGNIGVPSYFFCQKKKNFR